MGKWLVRGLNRVDPMEFGLLAKFATSFLAIFQTKMAGKKESCTKPTLNSNVDGLARVAVSRPFLDSCDSAGFEGVFNETGHVLKVNMRLFVRRLFSLCHGVKVRLRPSR
jgi:hypothetical protein